MVCYVILTGINLIIRPKNWMLYSKWKLQFISVVYISSFTKPIFTSPSLSSSFFRTGIFRLKSSFFCRREKINTFQYLLLEISYFEFSEISCYEVLTGFPRSPCLPMLPDIPGGPWNIEIPLILTRLEKILNFLPKLMAAYETSERKSITTQTALKCK